MSDGPACRCSEREKPVKDRRWVVTARYCHHSAFAGYARTYSDYSAVWCLTCAASWRTKAEYIGQLRDDNGDVERSVHDEIY